MMRWVLFFVLINSIVLSCNHTTTVNLNTLSFLKDINDSIHLYPNDPAFYLIRAKLLVNNNYSVEAIADIDKSWALLPSVSAAMAKFEILESLHQQNAAIEWLKKCNQTLKPPVLYLQLSLSNAYLSNKDTATAKTILIKQIPLIKISKNAFDVHQAGELFLCIKDTLQALEYARKSYQLQPNNNDAVFLICYILSMQKNKSILSFSDSLLKQYNNKYWDKIYFFKAHYFENIKQYQKAIVEYNKTLSLSWSFVDAYLRKASCQKALHQYTEALKTLNIASNVQTPTDQLMFEVADCYEHLKDTANAIEYYQYAMKNNELNNNMIEQKIAQLKK